MPRPALPIRMLLSCSPECDPPGTPATRLREADTDESLLWKAELPSNDPLGAKEGSPSTFAIGHGCAVAAYFHESQQQLVISAWLLASGQRQWTASISAKIHDRLKVALTERHVLVGDHSRLHAFSLSDGTPLWQIEKVISAAAVTGDVK